MGKITFIFGGARSGKSSYAVTMARHRARVIFVATGEAKDDEMAERIRLHKQQRPVRWQTIEAPQYVAAALRTIPNRTEVVILDCLTLWISNCMLTGTDDSAIMRQTAEILAVLRKAAYRSVLVANEVGLGIVPENQLARRFRDTAGMVNRLIAERAEEVVFMAAGIPWFLKKGRSRR